MSVSSVAKGVREDQETRSKTNRLQEGQTREESWKLCDTDSSSFSCSLIWAWRGSLPHRHIGKPWFLSSRWFVQLSYRTLLPVYTGAQSYSCSGSLLFTSQSSQTLDSGGRSGERKGADLLHRVFRLTPWEIQTNFFFYWRWLSSINYCKSVIFPFPFFFFTINR